MNIKLFGCPVTDFYLFIIFVSKKRERERGKGKGNYFRSKLEAASIKYDYRLFARIIMKFALQNCLLFLNYSREKGGLSYTDRLFSLFIRQA